MAPRNTQDFDALGISIERLPEETGQAYQAFLQYAWLQHTDRTNNKVAEKTGHSLMSIRGWAINHNWVERAALVDGLRFKFEFQQREQLQAEDNAKLITENRQIKLDGIKIARRMLTVADNLLNSAEVVDQIIETDHVETKDGRMIPTTTTIHMKAKVSDIPRLVDTAVKVSRLVQDLPTDIIQTQMPAATEVREMTTEQLMALREKVQRELRETGLPSAFDSANELSN